MSESDCLNLNVFVPTASSSSSSSSKSTKLPVMVFIHGGAFVQGSGSGLLYTSSWGSRLALRENVVLVTINYRLGAFGFLKVSDGDANVGMHDQLAALRWVQREIAAFGGDPVKKFHSFNSQTSQISL